MLFTTLNSETFTRKKIKKQLSEKNKNCDEQQQKTTSKSNVHLGHYNKIEIFIYTLEKQNDERTITGARGIIIVYFKL